MNSSRSSSAEGETLFRDLEGLNAVVTGATSGIGRAIAERMALAGARILIHGHRHPERASSVARICAELADHRDGRAEPGTLLADLSTPDGRHELLEGALDRMGRVDIWINNAGADVLTGEGAAASFEEKLELLWRTDVESTIHLSRAIGQHMRDGEGGVILNLGWDQADTGMAGDSGEYFAATKGAIMAFSRSLALSLAPRVRVNVLAPGWIRTAWGETAPEEWQERVLAETPARRWGRPEDVARVAHHLASPGSSYLTGQTIYVNGGAVR